MYKLKAQCVQATNNLEIFLKEDPQLIGKIKMNKISTSYQEIIY